MKEVALHTSSDLVWKMANKDAYQSGSRQLEPLHLLFGVLKIMDDAYHQDAELLEFPSVLLPAAAALAGDCRNHLGVNEEEITRLRRHIQKSLTQKNSRMPTATLHRSFYCKELFSRAALMAVEETADTLTILHLLKAILLAPPPDILPFVPARSTSKGALNWDPHLYGASHNFQKNRITIILTDMEGSMSIKRRFGDRKSAKIFRTHDTLFRNELQQFPNGKEIQSIGDSFLLSFTSEVSAVQFALHMQFQIRNHPFLAQIPLRVRIGIYTGNILTRALKIKSTSDPIFGITIDTTSRISSLAGGDQILTDNGIFKRSAQAVMKRLPNAVKTIQWISHGFYRFKGLEQPMEIFEVGEPGKAAFTLPKGGEKAFPFPSRDNPENSPAFSSPKDSLEKPGLLKSGDQNTHQIDGLGRDLLHLARTRRLAPVIGRNQEIKRLARILIRTSKRNVLLIGEPGVGKTAIVEGLAQRIVADNPPTPLRQLRIVQIDAGDLVSGTRYRGDMEKRIQSITREASADPNVVLFFDEIHLLMGAGASGGEAPMDAANILKSALTRDDFCCVGATTTVEFERYIQPDAAFLRRFQILRVEEPQDEDVMEICTAWVERIQERQQVIFEKEVMAEAITLSKRWIKDRSLPDKAVDLLENAAAYVKLSSLSFTKEILTKDLPRIGRQHLEAVLKEQYGIMPPSDRIDLDRVKAALQQSVLGQTQALNSLVDNLQLLCTSPTPLDRPLGIFLFTGPTGTGKTFTAECLASALFGENTHALGRFNMNEYKERQDIARLVGAPPGFIGHDQPGAIFRFVSANSSGIILLDEMEKAHPEICDFFLQIFDKGEARDSRGRVQSFCGFIVIMTCNIYPRQKKHKHVGFRFQEKLPVEEKRPPLELLLHEHFRPEFLARLDRVIPFGALGLEDYLLLMKHRLEELQTTLASKELPGFEITETTIKALCRYCARQDKGVRGFIRNMEHALVGPLWEHIRNMPPGITALHIAWNDEQVLIS